MRVLVIFLVMVLAGKAAEIVEVGKEFQSSKSCKACHKRIVDEWSNSWHANSHFSKDEYFRKSVEYVSKKSRKTVGSVQVECATCHNPRMQVSETSPQYEVASIWGLSTAKEIDDAITDPSLSEGINCVVCHNIDKIHDEYDDTKRGMDRVEWTPSGTMTGPYADAISPYHKTVHHDFMDKTPNRLCFVCHANDRSLDGLVFTNMQDEYVGDQSCVECHMGPKREDVAATYSIGGEKKFRQVRHHGFAGAHSKELIKGALSLKLELDKDELFAVLYNSQPHSVPSGFGGRELVLDLLYKDSSGAIVEQTSVHLHSKYMRKRDKPSIPHMALKQTQSMSVPPKSQKKVALKKPKNAASVDVTLSYRLATDEIIDLLDLDSEYWGEKVFIAKESRAL